MIPASVRASTPQLLPSSPVQRGSARARADGRTWSEISNYLAQKRQEALQAGYGHQEIDHHLGFRDPAPAEARMHQRATESSMAENKTPMPAGLKTLLDKVAALGNDGDTVLAHLSPGDAIIPVEKLKDDEEAQKALSVLYKLLKLNPEEFIVGHKANKINEKTGLPEFEDGGDAGGSADGVGESPGDTSTGQSAGEADEDNTTQATGEMTDPEDDNASGARGFLGMISDVNAAINNTVVGALTSIGVNPGTAQGMATGGRMGATVGGMVGGPVGGAIGAAVGGAIGAAAANASGESAGAAAGAAEGGGAGAAPPSTATVEQGGIPALRAGGAGPSPLENANSRKGR